VTKQHLRFEHPLLKLVVLSLDRERAAHDDGADADADPTTTTTATRRIRTLF
jgi:hypothetical protein